MYSLHNPERIPAMRYNGIKGPTASPAQDHRYDFGLYAVLAVSRRGYYATSAITLPLIGYLYYSRSMHL
jgi:hypothetical protein